jgi:exodeoxyribonuclease VII large subunit
VEHLSLYDLNVKIKDCLEGNLKNSYWVVAEIGDIRVNQKGHCYLELVQKVEDQIIAKNKATIWSYTYRNLSGWFESLTGQTLQQGLKILSNVVVSYHEVFGLSLNIKDIDANYTIGERARKRMEILKRLEKDGVVEMNRSLPLPLVPQRIALIASSTSAGYQDFMDQLDHNISNYQFSITHFQAIMQGEEAEVSIIQAMLEVNSDIDNFDVLVIIRGGGAALDLDCYDTYGLASHVAQFPIPVITGIGHERDETITDVVANTSLKTPTAVAEFLISGCRDFEEQLDSLYLKIVDYVLQTFKDRNSQLTYLTKHLRFIVENSFKEKEIYLNVLKNNIRNAAKGRKQVLETVLENYLSGLRLNASQFLSMKRKDLESLARNIDLVDPKTVLKRGYSITRSGNKIVKSAQNLHEGAILETEFKDGKIKSKICK